MSANPCSGVVPLETPPGVATAGKYVIVLDQYGQTKLLARPTNRSVLIFDGDDAYFVDGTDALPLVLNNIKWLGAASVLNGVLASNAAGRIFNLVNESDQAKVLTSQGGLVSWGNAPEAESDLPTTGQGILVKVGSGDPVWLSDTGLIYVDADGNATAVPNGAPGQILRMEAGMPSWGALPTGSIASGSAGIDLGGVVAASLDNNSISVQIPSFNLTDGVGDLTVANVNVSAAFGISGIGGLDVGAEVANEWYYAYVTSDGANVGLIFSTDPDSPDLTATTHTYWGFCSLFRNSGGNIRQYVQRGRQFWTTPVVGGDGITSSLVMTNIGFTTPLSQIIPPNVKSCSGTVGGNTDATAIKAMVMCPDVGLNPTLIGLQHIGASTSTTVTIEGFSYDWGMFHDMPILDASSPAIAWRSNIADPKRRITIGSYRI